MSGFLSYDSVGRRISGARRTAVLTTLAACCVVLGACAAREPKAPQFAHVDPDKQSNESFNERLAAIAATSSDLEYKIGPEDLLEVTLFDIENRGKGTHSRSRSASQATAPLHFRTSVRCRLRDSRR